MLVPLVAAMRAKGRRPRLRPGFALLMGLALAACASAQVDDKTIIGKTPLCGANVSLGTVVVAPQTDWRPDQKEPEKREAMAMKAINAAFADFPCGRVKEIRPIERGVAAASAPGAKPGPRSDIDTLVYVRVKELGPLLVFSVPVLWTTKTDVKFTMSAVDVKTGAVRLTVERHRVVGGPFAVRPAGLAEPEMEEALRTLIVRPPPAAP